MVMKKNLLIGIFGCIWIALPSQAQLQKGTMYLGATVTFDGSAVRPEILNLKSYGEYNRFAINPSFMMGKFFADNKMFGVGVGGPFIFGWGNSPNPDGTENKSHVTQGAYTLSPYLRHYKSLNSKWALFLTSAVDLAYLNISEKNRIEKASRNGVSAGLRIVPGISYWITPRFALESDVNLFSLSAGYKNFFETKSIYFNSAVTTGVTSYFSVRASWYIQKP